MPFDQPAGDRLEALIAAGLLQQLQGLDAGGHGQRIAAQGAGLVHGARGGHHRHDVGPAAVGAHGQAAADHLAHGGEVGGDAELGLGAAVADAEAGHHLVEHQQGAVLLGELADAFEEAGHRW
jgi:hypothetical protein